MSNSPKAFKVSDKNPKSYAAAVKGILKNPKNLTVAELAPLGTDLRKAQDNARNVSKVLLRTNSLSYEKPYVQDMFGLSKNQEAISARNVGTLEGIAPVSAEQSEYREPSKLRFNELVTVLFIEPSGLSMRTPPRERTDQETKAVLEELAKDVANCLVRDITIEADLANIRSILGTMIKENPNTVKRSLRVSKMLGTDICTVQFSKPNIKLLDDYYYEYEPNEDIKMSYLDYAVTLAIEQFTEKYNRVTEKMKRYLIALYSSIIKYLTGYLEGGNRRSRKGKKTSKKSKRSKKSNKKGKRRRTLRKNFAR